MRKKICPRPQCAKEYLEGEGFENLTICKLCGASLEEVEVFGDDYDIEADTNEFEENIDGEIDSAICEEDSFNEIIIATEDSESEEKDYDYTESVEENKPDEDGAIVEFEKSECDNVDIDPYEGIKGDNLILYKDNKIFKVYELKYDEIIIGRNSSEFTPDIDLQEIDDENAISRKHLLVYKEDDNYYIRNISKNCSVHIKRYDEDETKVVPFNESMIIEDGDFIVLSEKFILEAFFNGMEE